MLTHVKNYRSANLLVCNQFISDPFPQKKTGLDRVGEVRGKVSRQSRTGKEWLKTRVSSPWAA